MGEIVANFNNKDTKRFGRLLIESELCNSIVHYMWLKIILTQVNMSPLFILLLGIFKTYDASYKISRNKEVIPKCRRMIAQIALSKLMLLLEPLFGRRSLTSFAKICSF